MENEETMAIPGEENTGNAQENIEENSGGHIGEVEPVEGSKLDFSGENLEVKEEATPQMGDAAKKYDDFIKEESSEESNAIPEGSAVPEQELVPDSNLLEFKKKKSLGDILPAGKGKVVAVAGACIFLVLAFVCVSYFINNSAKKENKNAGVAGAEEAMIKSSFEAMGKLTSYYYNGKIKLDYNINKDSAQAYGAGFNASYQGVSENREGVGPVFYSNIAYGTTIDLGGQKSATDFGMEAVFVNGKQYVKIDNFAIQNDRKDQKMVDFENAMNGAKGSWYVVTAEDNGKFSSQMANYFSLPANVENANEINKVGVDDFSTMFADPQLLVFSKNLGDDNVEGVGCSHYNVDLSSEQALKIIADILEKQSKDGDLDDNTKKILDELKNNEGDTGKLKSVIDYILDEANLQIWIGKDDKFIHRFEFSGSFDKSFVARFAGKLKDTYGDAYAVEDKDIPDMKLEFDIDCTLSQFNTAKVREPENAKDFKEVMDKVNAIGPVSVSLPGMTTLTDTDSDGLSDEEEKFYGTDPNKADTDGDGYKDGDEVKNGYDPAVAGSARLDYNKLLQKN